MADNKKKTYGLIIPSKAGQVSNKSAPSSTFNVFGNESDEEDGSSVKKPFGSRTVKRQTQMDIEKAMQDDPTVYEYDSIYDDLQVTKSQAGGKEKSALAKKPRYITGLLKAAEVKKKEDERRKERQVQKEREAEGEMFADKEKFVTSAYKQKMLEMAEAEEKEKREAALENILDVTKQKDISGFYRYLYRTSTGNEDPPVADNTKMLEKKSPSSSSDSSDSERHQPSSSEWCESKDKVEFTKPNRPRHGGKFRQHKSDSSSPEPEKNYYKKRDRHGESRDSETGHQESRDGRDNHREYRDRRDNHRESRDGRDNHRESRDGRDNHRESRDGRDNQRELSRDGRDNQRESRDGRERYKGHLDDRDKCRESRDGPRASNEIKRRQRSSSPSEIRNNKSHQSESSNSSTRKRSRERGRSKEIIQHSKSPPGAVENIKATEPTTSGGTIKLSSDSVSNNIGVADNSDKTAVKSESVDPINKVYPYHNTAKDITEARKRYLQRKIAREIAA